MNERRGRRLQDSEALALNVHPAICFLDYTSIIRDLVLLSQLSLPAWIIKSFQDNPDRTTATVIKRLLKLR
jgi:hypothetical protein